MTYFKAKLHQIRFRPGRWGAYIAPQNPLTGFKGPTSKGKRAGEGWVRGGVGEGRGGGSGGRVGGTNRQPHDKILATPLGWGGNTPSSWGGGHPLSIPLQRLSLDLAASLLSDPLVLFS